MIETHAAANAILSEEEHQVMRILVLKYLYYNLATRFDNTKQ
jgi:hypothetical protein